MRPKTYQPPRVSLTGLAQLTDAVTYALNHVEDMYAVDDQADALTDLATLEHALLIQLDYAERGATATMKPIVSVRDV
jgi:hypothetical protein